MLYTCANNDQDVSSSYKCEECAASFDSKSELADHIHRMHGT